MNTLLSSQDAWKLVEKATKSHEKKPLYFKIKEIFLKNIRKKDKNALTIIYQVMIEDTFQKISNATITKEAWEIL